MLHIRHVCNTRRNELERQCKGNSGHESAQRGENNDQLPLRRGWGHRYTRLFDDTGIGKLQILRFGGLLVAAEQSFEELFFRVRFALQSFQRDARILGDHLLVLQIGQSGG